MGGSKAWVHKCKLNLESVRVHAELHQGFFINPRAYICRTWPWSGVHECRPDVGVCDKHKVLHSPSSTWRGTLSRVVRRRADTGKYTALSHTFENMSSYFSVPLRYAVTFLLNSLASVVKCRSTWPSGDKQVLKFLVFALMVPLLSSQPYLQGYVHLLLFPSCLPPLHLNLGKDEVSFDCYSPSNKTQHSNTVFRLHAGPCCKFFMVTQLF